MFPFLFLVVVFQLWYVRRGEGSAKEALMVMVTGAWWKRWLCLYLPLGAVAILTLFPFYYMAVTAIRPDREMYIPWNRPNFAPFWTCAPDAGAFRAAVPGDAVLRGG